MACTLYEHGCSAYLSQFQCVQPQECHDHWSSVDTGKIRLRLTLAFPLHAVQVSMKACKQ